MRDIVRPAALTCDHVSSWCSGHCVLAAGSRCIGDERIHPTARPTRIQEHYCTHAATDRPRPCSTRRRQLAQFIHMLFFRRQSRRAGAQAKAPPRGLRRPLLDEVRGRLHRLGEQAGIAASAGSLRVRVDPVSFGVRLWPASQSQRQLVSMPIGVQQACRTTDQDERSGNAVAGQRVGWNYNSFSPYSTLIALVGTFSSKSIEKYFGTRLPAGSSIVV